MIGHCENCDPHAVVAPWRLVQIAGRWLCPECAEDAVRPGAFDRDEAAADEEAIR